MLVAQDTFLIKVDNAINSHLNIRAINGKLISLDTDYNKFEHVCRIGTIFALPISVTSQYLYDTKLKVGDVVVFHHFVISEKNRMPFEGNIYRAEYFHLFAKIENEKIMPLEDIIFVEPILEPEENMFSGSIQVKSKRELLPQQGKVFALSKKAKDQGLKEGDHIFFTHNADYSMKIGNNDLWRMRLRNITFIIRDGKPVCLSERILIKEDREQPQKGNFDKSTLQLNGTIDQVGKNVMWFKPGMRVNFYTSIGGYIEFNGDKYCFVEPRHISYTMSWYKEQEAKSLQSIKQQRL